MGYERFAGDTVIVVRPIDVVSTGALLSSNIAATDYAVYSATTTYSVGSKVTFGDSNYEALVAGAGYNIADTSKWLELGATNRTAAFDRVVGTQSKRTGLITYRIQSDDLLSSIALLDVLAATIRIKMTDASAGVIYDKTTTMANSGVSEWHEYFFLDYQLNTDLVLTDLPAYAGALIDVDIAYQGVAAVGVILLGYHQWIGDAKYGIKVGIDDYSVKERRFDGSLVVNKGNYSARQNVALEVPTGAVDEVSRLLTSMRSELALYIAVDRFRCTYVYGFYRSFDLIIAGVDYSNCNLEIEGLI